MLLKSIMLSAVFLLTAAFAARAAKMEPVPVRNDLAGFPMDLAPWKGDLLPELKDNILAELRVSEYLNRVYEAPDQSRLGFYIGYYRSQRQGSTIHSPLNCLPGAGWNPIRRARIKVPVGNDSIEINNIVVQRGLERQVVLYWYQSHGRVIASEYLGKVYTILDAIRMNRTDAALVRVTSPVASLEPEALRSAESSAIEFVKLVFPLLARYLPA